MAVKPLPGEVKRVEGFDSGTTKCLGCGEEVQLYWNGGELDQTEHCGFQYRTQHVRTDLVVIDIGLLEGD